MKKFLPALLLLQTTFAIPDTYADKGMWMPSDIQKRGADMVSKGLQMPVNDLYNELGTGYNNAIVQFGGGCTGEMVSKNGLLFTNHHCAYGTAQRLASKDKDYFANGFWAKSMSEELPCPGLSVTFVRKIINVTDNITSGLDDSIKQSDRDSIVSIRMSNLEKGYKLTTGYDAKIRPYYNGNEYWVTLTETFNDVRMVGFPPNGIGSFGGDTDNWMWPRHGGDFAVFRVYANKNNKPADYAQSNVPYKPSKHLKINTSGVKEGDFTMVYGFPGRTTQYLSSYEVDQIVNILNPARIDIRTKRLDVMNAHMKADRNVFLKYTSKKAGVANAWKKWQGESRGIKINDVIGKKRAYEADFQNWASRSNVANTADNVLAEIAAATATIKPYLKVNEYINEAVLGIEILKQSQIIQQFLSKNPAPNAEQIGKLTSQLEGFYKNYDANLDKDMFTALLPLYVHNNNGFIPQFVLNEFARFGKDYQQWANYIFTNSVLANGQQAINLVAAGDFTSFKNDPALQLTNQIMAYQSEMVVPRLSAYNEHMAGLNRRYMKGQLALDKRTAFFPDANSTLRITYGQVQGIDPDGPEPYSYMTTLDEAVLKHNPKVEEFNMPAKLLELHQTKNYGQWASNGTVPVAFIATNHTSGGNSGSPVLNAKGELVGINFDRIWEGTMSDVYFDPNLCRNISVDIRYVLFVIDKVGGASWLLKEMDLVK